MILYRGFDHRHMKTVCLALQASTLKEKFREHLRRSAVSPDIRAFARAFPRLQEARHRADYDPATVLAPEEAISFIDAADSAMAAFDRADPNERADVLALLMIRTRD